MATSPTRADAATDGSFSDIDMEELDSYLTSPPVRRARAWRPSERVFARRFKIPPSPLPPTRPRVPGSRVPRRASAPASPHLARSLTASPRPPPSFPQEMINDDGDDALRAAARARLAARAAHVEGGMAAQAAAEAAVEAAALDRAAAAPPSLDANAPIANAALTPAASTFGAKRKHIISPPMKVHRRKDNSGAAGVVVARAARDLCGDLGEPKEALMRRAIDVIGIVAANDLAIEVGRIEGAGGQMTSDGARRRTPGGVFWALLRAKTSKEDWDVIFEEEKEAQRERCRRRRRAQSLNNSLASSPTLRSALTTPHGSGAFINQMGQMMNRMNQTGAADGEPAPAKTPAARVAAAPAATAAQRPRAAPARPTMAERISGAAAANATAANATAANATAANDSWAARMRRTVSAPAGSLDATMATEASSGSPPANQHAHSPGSPTVLTPDNDPSRAGAYAAAQGSYAARAKAAAEREAEEAAVRARALGLVAARRAAEAKLERADAPEAANVDDQVMMDAEEAQEQGEAQEQAAPAPAPAPAPAAPAWGVSFAAALRA